MKVLGFIIRIDTDFKLKLMIKYFFVYPILKYVIIVWCLHTATNACPVERVSCTFLRYANFLLNIPHLFYN